MTFSVIDVSHFSRPAPPTEGYSPVIPAQAGIQGRRTVPVALDSGFRRSDERRRPAGNAPGGTSNSLAIDLCRASVRQT